MSTRGWSATILSGAAAPTPPANDYNIYLDVTGGSDSNNGTAWNDAFLTWRAAMNKAERILGTNPETADIIINVMNGNNAEVAPASFSIAPCLPDRTRLHVVCPTDRWTVLGTGNVTNGGIVTELGSTLATVTVAGLLVPTANDAGKTLRISRPLGDADFGELMLLTILAVDVGTATYTVSTRHADFPALPVSGLQYDADALTVAELISPPNVLNGTLTFAPIGAPSVGVGGGVAAPKNWLFGIRANSILVTGEETACAACECRDFNTAGLPDGTMVVASAGGVVAEFIQTTIGGLVAYLTPAHARTWGLFGTTTVPLQVVGNSAHRATTYGGPQSQFAGYVVHDLSCVTNGYLDAQRFRAEQIDVSGGGQAILRYFRSPGTDAHAIVHASGEGTNALVESFAIEEVVGAQAGPAYIVHAENDSQVEITGTSIVVLAAVGATCPVVGFFADAARIEFSNGIVDALSEKVQGTLIRVDNCGEVQSNSHIQMAKARPGLAAASDILIANGSKMVLRGNLIKTIGNTIACRLLDVDYSSTFEQPTGDFTHGNAPADWAASFLSGRIWCDHGSKVRVGVITDTAGGAGANVAITCRHGSQIWFAANSAVTEAAAASTVVGSAAAGPFPVGTIKNDLPVAPDGTEELAVVGLL